MSRAAIALTAIAASFLLSALSTQPARAQEVLFDDGTGRRVIEQMVQSQIQSIRDEIQRRMAARAVQAVPFQAEDSSQQPGYDEVFGALGYAKSPTVKSTPSAEPTSLPLSFGFWATGSADHESSTPLRINPIGGNLPGGRPPPETITTTNAFVAGGDVTKIGIFTASDALVVGANGSFAHAGASASITGPGSVTTTQGIGIFTAYVNGGFSMDFAFGDTTAAMVTPTGISFGFDNRAYSYTGNVQYKFELPNAWWVEPTVGVNVAETRYGNPLGFPLLANGDTTTVQGGVRFGTEVTWFGIHVQPTFTGLAYSNVHVVNGGADPLNLTPNAKGEVWGKGDAKLNFVFSDKFSAYIEGFVQGTSGGTGAPASAPIFDGAGNGTVNTFGYSGQIGVRWVL
jgi:hypothetical protein